MFKSIYWKITLAFMLVAFTTAALVGVFIRLSSADRLSQLIVDQQRSNLEQTLSAYYAANGSWDGVDKSWRELQVKTAQTAGQYRPGPDNPPPNDHGPRDFLGLADADGAVIVPVDEQFPAGSKLPADQLKNGTPVTVDGQQVGTILVAQRPPGFSPQENQFLQRTSQALIYTGIGALIVALIMGIILARTLTRPLQALTHAAQSITAGNLEQQVEVRSNDEIGELATAFNHMSQEVSRSNQLRRQMTADIAHDLRTPLTTISGYIEAMQEGVLDPTPERLALIYSEIERLQKLVDDLRMLSLAEAGELPLNPQAVSPKEVLDQAAALFQHQAAQQKVSLEVDAREDLPSLQVDEARMMQIFGNLITNALRYTPSGGKVQLSAQAVNGRVELDVQDTGSGIPAEELPYIFDRFHRADKSRHSENGESGLGLAIVKALVDSHGGQIWAESNPGQGTTIHLSFPIETKS
ncbi:MAG TPA: ATP-binding protein [Anaerolineaceae bacterium]|nr:ATP-binding protein [Anaerolineaceae bacterium]